jgi:hypothetical protein
MIEMKIIDKIRDYFFGRKIKVKNIDEIKEISDGRYYNVAIYSKIPFRKKYCVWSTYVNDIDSADGTLSNAYKNKMIVKEEMSLFEYINNIWYYLKDYWLNVIDIIHDDGDIVKKSKGVFKNPVKKWYFGLGVHKRVFKPYSSDYINPILYINSWSLSWKPKYDYICFEDNPQVWVCLFKFFWFGYKLTSPIKEDFEDYYWEQMIWYVNYCDCDLKKSENTYFGKWDKKYLI